MAKKKPGKVKKVLEQVREPLSLLGTLKEEGMANAALLIGMAGNVANEAAKNLRLEHIKPHLKEIVQSLGFVTRSDLEKLEARLEELEERLHAMEAAHEYPDDE